MLMVLQLVLLILVLALLSLVSAGLRTLVYHHAWKMAQIYLLRHQLSGRSLFCSSHSSCYMGKETMFAGGKI